MIVDMPIIGYYGLQRFKQFNPSDVANWYLLQDEIGKKNVCMMPTLGRKHIKFEGFNRLIFDDESRAEFKSINYWYNVVNDKIFRIDQFFNEVEITGGIFNTIAGDVYFTFLVAGEITFSVFVAGHKIFVYREDTGSFQVVTDALAPTKPKYIATFGNRIGVSQDESSEFNLSVINLGGGSFDPTQCFNVGTVMDPAALFASESGVIRQMGVLENTLYIFTDYTIGIWSNIISTLTSAAGVDSQFPWKKNTTYAWDTGIAFPNTLSIGFGKMAWVGKNFEGLIEVVSMENGQLPQSISDSAIAVLLQRLQNISKLNPFLPLSNVDGFLYSYDDTIHYRLSIGDYTDTQLVDQVLPATSIEFSYDSKKWNRVTEKNGERNRVQKHVFFGGRHLVSVLGDSTVYELSGEYYTNDIENPDQNNLQAPNAYIAEPFRYERITSIITAGLYPQLKAPGYYAELETKYVEIDMVWGESAYYGTEKPLTWFKPHVELYYSNDGGISFLTADVLEIAEIGIYQWRMRWYQLGCHRNRVYKLIVVSTSPIVILGGVMEVSNVSGGAS